MKTLRAFVLLTLLGIQAHANDSEALPEVQEERKALLENTVRFLERQHGLGKGDHDDLFNARIRLNRFYRNHASDQEQKRTFQAKIVNLKKLRFLSLKSALQVGIDGVSILEVMRAEERFLAAKQKYLQIDAKENQSADQDGADQTATPPKSKLKSKGKDQAKPQSKEETTAKTSEVGTLLETGRAAGSLPRGVVVRLHADLATATPLDSKERSKAESRGIDFEKTLKETWEFTSDHVHRVAVETKDQRRVYRRVESRPFDTKNLCKELIDGELVEVEAREGKGKTLLFAGTDYDIGDRSIEVTHNGNTVLEAGECCVFGGFPESDARAFAALYERLATQARALFESKVVSPK